MIRDSEWTKERILEELSQRESEFALRFGVRRIGIFGSRARGDATATSDIDVLVEMDKPTFGAYMDLKFMLEDLFACSVDLVLAESLKPRIRPIVLQEVDYAWTRQALHR